MNQKLKPMIYVACLAAYNAGHLHGEWLDAAREAAEIQEDIRAILQSSPVDSGGDFAIHDYEGFGDLRMHRMPPLSQFAASYPDPQGVGRHAEALSGFLDPQITIQFGHCFFFHESGQTWLRVD